MTQTDKQTIQAEEALYTRNSLAALLGNALNLYGKTVLHVTLDDEEDADKWVTKNYNQKPNADVIDNIIDSISNSKPQKPTSVIEPENPGTQILQVATLIHPTIQKYFGSSAIYRIFSETLHRMGWDGDTIEKQLDGKNLITIAGMWVIAKRTFAYGHAEDCLRMIDALVTVQDFNDRPPLDLSAATSADFENLAEFFKDLPASNQESESPEGSDQQKINRSITELISSDKLYLPTSKAFRKQREIAKSKGRAKDNNQVPINVGNGVKIMAKITGPGGELSIELTRFEMDIQATVGQMFQENGFRTITITPAQVYRKYAYMDQSERVTPENIEKTIAALDKLITTPATLSFTKQIEQHTHLKKQPHFDYSSAERSGNLITGVHDKKKSTTYRGTVVEDSFTIHEMPMFYAYSYAVSQIRTIQANLLTGEEPKENEKKIRAKKTERTHRLTSDEIGLRRYLLERIDYSKNPKGQSDSDKASSKTLHKPRKITNTCFLFSEIAEDIGYDISTPKRNRQLREQVYNFMLEQVKLKNIKSVDYQTRERSYIGVRITF